VALRLSDAAVTASVAAVTGLIDAGSAAGSLRIYTGTQPAGPGTTTAETLLAELDFNDPAFAAGSAGEQDMDASPSVTTTGLADGTAGWFRIVDSDAAAGAAGIIDGAVTATGGGGELELNTLSITTGVTITITAGNVAQPTS